MQGLDEWNIRIERILTEKSRCIVSMNGRCASGKSTLGAGLAEKWNGSLLHMDHFFLRMEQRTPERYQTPGENVDHERFLEEVLTPLSRNIPFTYYPFTHETMSLSDIPVYIEPKPVTVIEGSYSQRDDLRGYYDLNVAIDINPDLQIKQKKKRNPERLQMFIDKWIPLEEMYFKAYRIYERADIVLQAERD